MTQGSRSGAGRGNQRRTGPGQGTGRGQGPSGAGRGGAPRGGSPRGDAPRDGAPRGGSFRREDDRRDAPRQGGPRSDEFRGDFRGGSAERSGGYRGAGSPGAGKPGSGAAGRGGKPGAGKASGAAGRGGKAGAGKPSGKGAPAQRSGGRGPRPFGNERFGRNLGPVTHERPKTPKPAQGAPARNSAVEDTGDGVRLQKVMANAGVASRRVSEDMIAAGRVEVNGELVTEPGLRVDPSTVTIHVDGMRIQLNESLKYFVFNKPRGVVSTMEDPEGRPCVSDYLKKKGERLFHVGRLDVNTEGLLLLTNDGELANRLTHPSYEVPKTYLVQVPGPMPHGIGAQMKQGMQLEDGWANVDSFKLVDSTPGKVLVEVVLHSGRNRIVRRLFDAVGHPVKRLVRVQLGPIRLGDQKQGTIRPLGNQEVGHLLSTVGM